ncbi:DDB1- and CUL4-associated factor 1-like [Synchiropus splendidus]|uniref:DDB1- and CUL4-associated factor 1-like n=1 Tax=Synchiropus splendidus TaxID=270530 RepID=UPI00237DDE5E|nr:DDB1- and CUL4-associated factor 1-like [Synchiropus splendidus]XP_053723750.1 DDB1- and CUL4-associated factor 1-like [Synchiropus splendidus]
MEAAWAAAVSAALAATVTDVAWADMAKLMDEWEAARRGSTDQLVSVLNRISVLVEQETHEYRKTDTDPFDDRHPGRVDPNCMLGKILKFLLKNDDFTNTLLDNYIMTSREQTLNSAACRLLLNITPGLETAAVFQDKEGLVDLLFSWALEQEPPLSSYAIGLLAKAMNNPDVESGFQEKNTQLVPLVFTRLKELQSLMIKGHEQSSEISAPSKPLNGSMQENGGRNDAENSEGGEAEVRKGDQWEATASSNDSHQVTSTPWSEMSAMVVGSDYCLFPLSPTVEQRLILQYLAPLADHQELLSVFVQLDARPVLMNYLDLNKTRNVQLTYDSLLFLATMLQQKKFAAEFIAHGGVQKLLQIPRRSMAATGVSFTLYFLAYNHDAMERVCMLPGQVLSDMVSYGLCLLESSHSSGVCHATLFFSVVFSFRAALQLFDQQDGLRRLVNLISTLDIMNMESEASTLNDDQIFSCRQTARHTCLALLRYFEAHLALEVDHVKSLNGGSIATQNIHKAVSFPREQLQEMMEFLVSSPRLLWEPVRRFCSFGCFPVLIQLLESCCHWRSYSGRSDLLRYILDVVSILTVVPKVQLLLADTVEILDENRSPISTVGMSIILGIAEGMVSVNDADIQKSALQVIINCVWAPDPELGHSGGLGTPLRASLLPQHGSANTDPVLNRMCSVVQNNNGIKVLLSLLTVKSPITDADQIRTLACKALVGLCRSHPVRQIIGKLPLFSSGLIQQLMKEPVLQDKRSEHVRFCRYAGELIQLISGKRLLTGADVSLARLQRADVVARSRITFPQKELLLLIRNHLLANGLPDTANTLVREANLTPCHPSPCHTPSSSQAPRFCRLGSGNTARASGHQMATPVSAHSHTPHSAAPPVGRILFSKERPHTSSGRKPRPLRQKSDHGAFNQTPAMKKQLERHLPLPPTLDGIITEYLREQHAHCSNPVTTCPPFSLFTPHRCPVPRLRRQASANFTARLGSRLLHPKYSGLERANLDRHLIFSRFRPLSVFHKDDSGSFTCCSFSADQRHLLLGNTFGHLKFFNMFSGEEEADYTCHSSSLTHIQPSRDGNLLLTSALWSRPLSSLWSLDGTFTLKSSFTDDHHVEFSKLCQDRIVGSKDQTAHIYDLHTGQKTHTLLDSALSNFYKRNCATFSPTDELVLSDGVLWDVRASRAVHKFDKFNDDISGVFHPNGLEVIINTEIWDLRTFHLLHTVSALDRCRVVFNSNGTVIYGAVLNLDDEDDVMEKPNKSPFESSFRTLNASDYKPIATLDVKRHIFDLCADSRDCYLALIEDLDSVGLDAGCRLYEVGRHKLAEEARDDDDEEDDEDEDDDADDQDSSDSDDDIDTDIIDELVDEIASGPISTESTPTHSEVEALFGNGSDDSDNDEGNRDGDASRLNRLAGILDSGSSDDDN